VERLQHALARHHEAWIATAPATLDRTSLIGRLIEDDKSTDAVPSAPC
jgi:hypothetical protein